jgi:LacI family transcriptional regulator
VRAHILKIADELGYRRNLSARAMRTGKTGAIGLVLPDFANPFFTALAQCVMKSARQAGYCVFVTDTENSEDLEQEAFRRMIDRGVDGVVWFPIRDVNTVEAESRRVPTLLIDRSIPGLASIRADYEGGGRRAAEHLMALGHERIGIISGPLDVASMRARVDGAAAALGDRLAFKVASSFSMELEPEALAVVQSRKATAIFAGTDLIALGVIRAAQAAGLSVPGDLAVIGFGDMPWAQLSSPPLSSIEMPLEDMATEAVDALLRRIEGEDGARSTVFDTALIIRQSTDVAPHT